MDFKPLVTLLTFNALFAAGIIALLLILSWTKHATFAVLRRNFVGYFSNPTGYVFICVFMLLSSIAAFWPQAFFSENLATLYQLNKWFPLVMLIFIPAITMGIWAEEQREGTDELLLTMPAGDTDIVLGKYLAAALIYTVALIFSQISNFRVLNALAQGDLDMGLFLATYLGYWLLGLCMIAIGMTASFFTSNLTVGYILGALFNAPLVFLSFADRLIANRAWAQALTYWSLTARFRDFGRGVIGLSSSFFFLSLIAVGIYASLVLIGRRHWLGGKDGKSMLGHYLIRGLSLLGIAIGTTGFLTQHDWLRADVTQGQVSSLAPETRQILRELSPDKPVLIEAFVSASVPEAYVETKVDLINKLREMDAVAGPRLVVQLHDGLEPFTEEAARAEEQYGITPQTVMTRSAAGFKEEELILGAAIVCGLERVVVPYFGRGIPVEYELIRSIKTASGAKRKRLGVLKTDAQMFGGFDMSTFSSRPKQRIITELEKQYEVEQVDPSSPIDETAFDALLVVQPSSLTQPQMNHLIAAIRNGVPTALFEDPMPVAIRNVSGTGEPRRPSGGPFGGPPPEPKGDLTRLWSLLGIDMVGEPTRFGEGYNAHIIWQAYNPYPKISSVANITNEWVFLSPEAPSTDDEALSIHDPVTAGLREVLCIFPGAIRNLSEPGLEFTVLMKTGEESGWISPEEYYNAQRSPRDLMRAENLTRKKYVLAARIKGFRQEEFQSSSPSPLSPDQVQIPVAGDDRQKEPMAATTASPTDNSGEIDERRKEIHVAYVCDIDMLSSEFLQIREEPDDEMNWRFENVTFVLNLIDSLVGENDLIEIRKRRPRHSTLKRIDAETEEARQQSQDEIQKFSQEFEDKLKEEQDRIEQGYKELEKKIEQMQNDPQANPAELQKDEQRLRVAEELARRRVAARKAQLERELERKLEKKRHDLNRKVQAVQMRYKLVAVWPSLVLPLVVGLGVWIIRSQKEREGVAEARLR